MKTCLFTPCYLEGFDPLGSSRLIRNRRYLSYYLDLKQNGHLNFDDIWMADNASDPIKTGLLLTQFIDLKIHRFEDNLPRGEGPVDYPYIWRAIYFMQQLIAMGYEKIILIDSDSFIVSARLARYVNDLMSGFVSFWSQKYLFPTTELSILCKDSFERFREFCQIPWELRVGTLMERELPYSHVETRFNCDRYGEKHLPQTAEMDGYFQASVKLPLRFNLGES